MQAQSLTNLELASETVTESATGRVVIVGNGPVGIEAARRLLRQSDAMEVVLYGDEPYEPYNRVRLSSVLAGQLDWQSLVRDLPETNDDRLQKRYGCRVVSIDVREKTLTDDAGRQETFDHLILATGSRPRMPSIDGIDKHGIYTFRDLADVIALMARQARSRHTVVLGGGLLGLEAAHAMQRQNTRVTVIEHSSRLLPRQLDDYASALVEEHVCGQGVQLIKGQAVAKILGGERIEGLQLKSGVEIACDTLIVAAGIVPNIGLAQRAGIAFGRGIRVDDAMQTSFDNIFAIGECAEHRGKVYGLVAPGLEQAGVAIHNLLGGDSVYLGSLAASRLKVLALDVYSCGPMGEEAVRGLGRVYRYRDDSQGVYRKLLVHRHRLIGALSIGPWREIDRIQSCVTHHSPLMPWQLWRFVHTGSPWPAGDAVSVNDWPANAPVCQCTGVSRGVIGDAIRCGSDSLDRIAVSTGAGSVCGSCRPLLSELLGGSSRPQPARHARTSTVFGVLGMILALALLSPAELPYQQSVQAAVPWDQLWRDGLLKQITGFSMLGLVLLGLLVSLRKRVKGLHRFGSFDAWRLFHLALGLLTLLMLVAHTGLRTGNGLNAWLMISFTGLVAVGALNATIQGQEHQLDAAVARKLRKHSLWWHILLFWPVPVLLTFHVLKGYWF